MIDAMMAMWSRMPAWGQWLTAAFVLFALSSRGPAIHEGDPLAFLENFLALTFHWGLVLGSFACSIWGGMKIAERTQRNWLGWVVGLSIFVAFVVVSGTFQRLPGIGWRMKAMSNSDCYVDWDGRSNPTVCD